MGNKNAKNNTVLNDKEIQLLSANTGLSRQEILEWHSQFLIDFPDGLIDVNEFGQIYKKLYPNGKSDTYAKFAFKAFDNDKSGKITFSEFILATSFLIDSNKSNDVTQSYEMAFDVYDVDDNGKIDKKEAINLLSAVYEIEGNTSREESKKTVEELFRNYDTDKSGFLTKQEFVSALVNDPQVRKAFLVN